jgi:phosphopantothenoylcysteine decarboxylase/phosphopantothenate--cysteine ligase
MFGKRILLGITGGIAAYKTASLVRLLKKSGADVRCVLTPSASSFISPLVLATLSENGTTMLSWPYGQTSC